MQRQIRFIYTVNYCFSPRRSFLDYAVLIVVVPPGDGVLPGVEAAHGAGPAPHRLQAYPIHHTQCKQDKNNTNIEFSTA